MNPNLNNAIKTINNTLAKYDVEFTVEDFKLNSPGSYTGVKKIDPGSGVLADLTFTSEVVTHVKQVVEYTSGEFLWEVQLQLFVLLSKEIFVPKRHGDSLRTNLGRWVVRQNGPGEIINIL